MSKVQEKAVASCRDTGLNQAQLHFLQMLSYIKTDEALMDLNV